MSLVSLWAGTEWGSGISLSCSPWGKLQVGFSPAFLPLFSCLGCLYPLCLPGLSMPSGECTAGFYCKGGAVLPNPTDDVTGNICPEGTYCSKYPASVSDSNSLAFNIWNPDGWFWECDGQLAGLWSGCPESQILLLVAYPYSESRDIFVSLLEAVCLQDVFSFTSINHYKIKLISVLFHAALLDLWVKIRFHCCPFHAALHSFSPQMQQYLFFHIHFFLPCFSSHSCRVGRTQAVPSWHLLQPAREEITFWVPTLSLWLLLRGSWSQCPHWRVLGRWGISLTTLHTLYRSCLPISGS